MKKNFHEEHNALLQEYDYLLCLTNRECIDITLSSANDITPLQSKFFGIPYLVMPEHKNYLEKLLLIKSPYPKDIKGKDLYLLAQINFSEVPENELFPNSGILQFWISDAFDHGSYSENNVQNKCNFRIIYHENIQTENLINNVNYIPDYLPINYDNNSPDNPIPSKKDIMKYGFKLNFKKNIMHATPDTDYIYNFLTQNKLSKETIYEIRDILDKFEYSNGNRMGGYPKFTQPDPGFFNNKDSCYDTLLLQFDASWNSKFSLVYGCDGVINFFINQHKLRNKDFSDVYYHMDFKN